MPKPKQSEGCLVEGCNRKYHIRGLCKMHHNRRERHGDVGGPDSTRRLNGTGGYNALGYLVTRREGKKRYDHVLKVEQIIGRKLPSKAVIHHINGNPSDNSNSNLVICENQSYHMLLHHRETALRSCGRASWKRCWICKQYDDPINMIVRPSGEAYHKTCQRESERKYALARRQKKAAEIIDEVMENERGGLIETLVEITMEQTRRRA